MNQIELPTLTAVMVNYNHGRFIPHSLGSLLAQLRPADELIVLDDASTDDSVSIIAALIAGYPNARLVRNPSNIGCVGTMNRSLELAKGDYVFFAASDDVFYPGLFRKGMEFLVAHPQAGLFSARCDVIDENGENRRLFATPVPGTSAGYISPQASAVQLQRNDSWFLGNTTIYRRARLMEEGGFNDELGSLADGFMSRVLALKYGACFTPDSLGGWRRQQGGMAWSQALSADHSRMFALVEREITRHGDLFPTGYFHRWQRRYRFGTQRFASQQRSATPGGSLRQLLARAGFAIKTGWLFVRLRPWDIWPAIVRLHSAIRHRD
jgi:glycosyltransferase involved in cell wall biosynthesis